jgi:polar amino acid transport system substrate-binding protein
LTPKVTSVADLHGLTVGIQSGNTSEFVAQRWLTTGAVAKIEYYPYDGILSALAALEAGRIGVIIKLFPVISWLVKDRAQLEVAMQVPTHERLGIAFAKDNSNLCNAINGALETLHSNGEFAQLKARWFPATPGREVNSCYTP